MAEAAPNEERVQAYSVAPELIHNLRTPLNQIIGYSELLRDRTMDAGLSDYTLDLERVITAGHGLLAIIQRSFESSGSVAGSGAPVLERPAEPLVSDTVPQSPAAETKAHLLVVDDDEGNRQVLSRRLAKEGYSFETAANGRDALRMIETGAFDVVLLDIMMPEMDGFEVLRRVKNHGHLRHIPVIVISALDETDSVARCIEMGAEDYLTKPINAVLLKARISASLERKRGRDRERGLFEQLQANYSRLEEAEKLRDDLMHMIVHDLRTPLTSVIAAIQTLGMVGEVNQDQREVVDIAESGAEALLGMINSLLDVEKFESGSMNLDYEWLAPSELVAFAVLQVDALAEAKQIAITQDVLQGIPMLQGDKEKLLRILVNLLGNALKFTPKGGSVGVLVRARDGGRSVEFCVTDSGEGIPPDAFERIFEKFGQVESRRNGKSMSTGLGLTFCKLAVEAHHGRLGVTSSLGTGSTFCFDIPVVVPVSTAQAK